MSATNAAVEFIALSDGASIPDEVIRRATQLFTNAVAVTVAGAGEPAAQVLARVVAGAPQPGPATLIGSGRSTVPLTAALVNGTASHALDLDDGYVRAFHHPSVGVFAAVLALAEDRGASGRALIEAFTIGVEVSCRLSDAVDGAHFERGWHTTGTVGAIGAAAGCARLLGLTPEATRHALGIAASLAAGIRQNVGTMTKPLHAGHACHSGVLASLLASQGFDAGSEALEGAYGFARSFNRAALESGWEDRFSATLGRPYAVIDPGVLIKPAPCKTSCAIPALALLDLVRQHDIRPDHVEAIECGVNSQLIDTFVHRSASTPSQAKYCLPYVLAVALIDRQLGVDQFTAERIGRDDVMALMRRVNIHVPDALRGLQGADHYGRMQLRVRRRDDTDVEGWTPWTATTAAAPYPEDALRERFVELVGKRVGAGEATASWDIARALPNLTPDALRDFMARLA